MHMGGFINSSKIDCFKNLNKSDIPTSVLFPKNTAPTDILTSIKTSALHFPVILKPNSGERGKGVKKVQNEAELRTHLDALPSDFILQEYIDMPLEFGVLYYKYPRSGKDNISSIALKEMPVIQGNNQQSIEELVLEKYNHANFENLTTINRTRILQKGESFQLEYIAHRSRYSTFRNYNHIYCSELLETFRKIATNIDGFQFGRFDVKVNNVEDLIFGKNIKILEVNGTNSLPIHIFDPNFSFFKTYADLGKHWRIIYNIHIDNLALGNKPASVKQLFREIKLNKT